MVSSLLLIPRWIPWVVKYISCSLTLGWIPLSGEFMASYLWVDSLSGEVNIYPSIISTHLIVFSF